MIEPEAVVDGACSEDAEVPLLFARCGTYNHTEGIEDKSQHP